MPVSAEAAKPKRFHGSVPLDQSRVDFVAGRTADKVIVHLVGLVGFEVSATLEIAAEMPGGATEKAVRTVTENA